jgi:hypothetical protein
MLTELAEKNGIVPALPTPGAGGDEFDTTTALEGGSGGAVRSL